MKNREALYFNMTCSCPILWFILRKQKREIPGKEGTGMNYEIVTLQKKRIVGVSVRTSNASPDMQQKIGELWTRYFREINGRLAGGKGQAAYGLYTNYENGAQGDYDAFVGCEVDGDPAPQEGIRYVTIPAGSYAKFQFHGDVTKDMGIFWKQVWQENLPRKFTCDFEEYSIGMGNGQPTDVAIYVALADFCQSCGMPMTEASQYGTNADGTRNTDYCRYCYQNGAFLADCTMEQMVDFCLDVEKDSGRYTDRAEAKRAMLSWFPELKRWKEK